MPTVELMTAGSAPRWSRQNVEGEDGDGIAVGGGVVGGGEEAAEGRLDAEHGEVVAADELSTGGLGGVGVGEVYVGGSGGEEETGEDVILIAEVAVHGDGRSRLPGRRRGWTSGLPRRCRCLRG